MPEDLIVPIPGPGRGPGGPPQPQPAPPPPTPAAESPNPNFIGDWIKIPTPAIEFPTHPPTPADFPAAGFIYDRFEVYQPRPKEDRQ